MEYCEQCSKNRKRHAGNQNETEAGDADWFQPIHAGVIAYWVSGRKEEDIDIHRCPLWRQKSVGILENPFKII